MTVREILSAMGRRWYIPLALLLCAVLATVMLARDGGVYSTRTVVSFMHPAATSLSPTNGTSDVSVIAFAGAVVQEMNNGRPPARFSMAEAPYYGAGLRQGVLVTLTNSGNQWVSTFSKSEVEVQIVGRSLNWVETMQDELVHKILIVSDARQAALAVAPDARIKAAVVPLTTHIEYVHPSFAGQIAAAAAMIVVALILGAWGSITVDRLLWRRRIAQYTQTQVLPYRILEGSPS